MVVYPAIFHPNDDGSVTVTFPDLPGCVTEGADEARAAFMASDALALWLDTIQMLGGAVPPPSPAKAVDVGPDECVALIDANPEAYARARKGKAVKRTVSLPEWMDERAAQENISLSRELQAALSARFGSNRA